MRVSVRGSLVCPACEIYELEGIGARQARCGGCGYLLSGPMLKILVEIVALSEAHGTHACEECEHPQMRRLPDGVFYCPACHAEVTPIAECQKSSGTPRITARASELEQE